MNVRELAEDLVTLMNGEKGDQIAELPIEFEMDGTIQTVSVDHVRVRQDSVEMVGV